MVIRTVLARFAAPENGFAGWNCRVGGAETGTEEHYGFPWFCGSRGDAGAEQSGRVRRSVPSGATAATYLLSNWKHAGENCCRLTIEGVLSPAAFLTTTAICSGAGVVGSLRVDLPGADERYGGGLAVHGDADSVERRREYSVYDFVPSPRASGGGEILTVDGNPRSGDHAGFVFAALVTPPLKIAGFSEVAPAGVSLALAVYMKSP